MTLQRGLAAELMYANWPVSLNALWSCWLEMAAAPVQASAIALSVNCAFRIKFRHLSVSGQASGSKAPVLEQLYIVAMSSSNFKHLFTINAANSSPAFYALFASFSLHPPSFSPK
jgi:hypothetical protein